MQVLSVINRSSAVQDDQHSMRVSATAMAALVPAWLKAGRDSVALWQEVSWTFAAGTLESRDR